MSKSICSHCASTCYSPCLLRHSLLCEIFYHRLQVFEPLYLGNRDVPYIRPMVLNVTPFFGNKEVAACVTKQGENGSRRLFFCTNLEACKFFLQHQASLPEGDAQSFVRADEKLVFLAIYSMRWTIETSYLELKTFWDFGKYKVRHKTSIERLLNLQSMVYSILSLLPALDNAFASMEGLSVQERRWRMEQLISRQIFFAKLGVQLQNDKNQSHFLQLCNELTMKDDLAA